MSSQKAFRVARYIAAGAFTVLTFSAAAHAGDVPTALRSAKITVRYSDLDLSKQSDAQVLYRRLQRASGQVCMHYRDLDSLSKKKLYDQCYQNALARAVDRIDHATVNAAYAADERVRIASR